ncbi:MAG: NAD(P)-dependent oxidoreductase [Gemmatimonadetes bacterium]|nr:NAD(P)-dependent oxidoreductase [Gemmatimonadota bacterium]
MRVAVIGADRPWGALLAAELGAEFEVVAIGAEETSDLAGYRQVDLLQREALDPVLAGVEAIVHAAGGDPAGDGEGAVLDTAARGTYVALTAACAVGIEKAVLLSRLDLLRDYPEEYIVDPQWNALPRAEAGSLAPLMAELVGREIARTGQIEVRCLRLGELDKETTADDAVEAVRQALTAERRGHDWLLAHVASSGRFAWGDYGNGE